MSSDPQNPNDKADFETAIEATKFGKFNILLLLVALPAGWTAVFDTAVMSYVFPAAQCDLALTLLDKGTLNAIIYGGKKKCYLDESANDIKSYFSL